MSTRDEAVEAMAEAMDTAYNPDRYPIMTAMFRDYADTALTALFLAAHPHCHLGIVDEYGREHPTEEKDR